MEAALHNNERYSDIIFNDYGHTWESLRRVSHTAMRKYAKSDDLSKVVDEVVRETVDLIKNKHGLNKPFAPKLLVYNMVANIVGTIVFSQKFDIEQDELIKFKYCFTDFQSDLDEMMKYIMDIYTSHNDTYNRGVIRDFCDTLIMAKHEAVEQDKLTAPYLTDENLAASINDLLMGGVETSSTTFEWMLLFMAYHPKYQQKLRDEITREIGDKVPMVDDKPSEFILKN
ncbi:unnamed protein product [Oppiella nova]|uniref:Cytochrome P450 n=1 Tax=Oppiella nova TaxID=334625 RepID=A0A7R9MEA3_9ACAR|nr:unnamed protein product [Oppiella nova]CAG2174806.1 unnamed protein product [Oppiella nova]